MNLPMRKVFSNEAFKCLPSEAKAKVIAILQNSKSLTVLKKFIIFKRISSSGSYGPELIFILDKSCQEYEARSDKKKNVAEECC